jgi:hypothetical protein
VILLPLRREFDATTAQIIRARTGDRNAVVDHGGSKATA